MVAFFAGLHRLDQVDGGTGVSAEEVGLPRW